MGVMIKNGIKYTGGGNQVFSGTTSPDSSLGLDNDIYMKYNQNIVEKSYCKINNVWKEVQGSGGESGDGGMTSTVLYSGNSEASTITLSAPLTDYDIIVLRGNYYRSSDPYMLESTYTTFDLETDKIIGISDDNCYLWYIIGSDFQTLTRKTSDQSYYISKIIGIKFNYNSKIAVFESELNVNIVGGDENSQTPPTPYQCTHNISDYDLIGFSVQGGSEIHWVDINKTAAKTTYIGDVSNVNHYNGYALTECNITIDPVNNTIINNYSTMYYYIDGVYTNYFYQNRKIENLYFIRVGLPSYSTTEQKTGQKWIDGKDVYQKVIETTMANTITDGTFAHKDIERVDYIDTLIELSGIISFSTASKGVLPYTTNGGNHARVSIATTDIQGNPYPTLRASSSSVTLANQPCTIIMKYTKTNS